jgi:hypothetical protein
VISVEMDGKHNGHLLRSLPLGLTTPSSSGVATTSFSAQAASMLCTCMSDAWAGERTPDAYVVFP